ncbi:MAG TPA: PqqD family protein [Burkholderiales bacterium]|nr:PqqD family protein [Burkholderiales bacterium]
MTERIGLEWAYGPSEDVVVREIEGELIIVPLVAGVGDLEDELFTLNETGRAVWQKLDGRKSVRTVVSELAEEFDAPAGVLEQDVVGLLTELERRRIVVRKG